MGFDDPHAHGQSQSRPRTNFLGCEEWIEDSLQVILTDPAAVVTDLHEDGRIALVAGRNLNDAGIVNCIVTVQQEIHDDFLEEVMVNFDGANIWREFKGDFEEGVQSLRRDLGYHNIVHMRPIAHASKLQGCIEAFNKKIKKIIFMSFTAQNKIGYGRWWRELPVYIETYEHLGDVNAIYAPET